MTREDRLVEWFKEYYRSKEPRNYVGLSVGMRVPKDLVHRKMLQLGYPLFNRTEAMVCFQEIFNRRLHGYVKDVCKADAVRVQEQEKARLPRKERRSFGRIIRP